MGDEILTADNEPDIIESDNGGPDMSAGATAPEDTHNRASNAIIESLEAENAALRDRIKSLDEQIAHVIRSGGQIGTIREDVPADTGQVNTPEIEMPDFAQIARDIIG